MIRRFFLYVLAAVFLSMTPGGPAGIYAAGEVDDAQQGSAQIRVFMYHHFGLEDTYPSTSVSEEQFKKHLDYLQEHEYTVLPLGAALERLYAGKEIPEKTAVISIDDGYRSVWDKAIPLLEKHGYPATIFVSTGYVGGGGYMSWEQINRLGAKGFEIGNHSHAHPYFLNKPKGEIKDAFEQDLKTSHEQFQKHLGRVPDLYAYPFGEYTPAMMSVLKDHGYMAAAAQRSGVIYRRSSRFALPRFPMNKDYAQMEDFQEKIRMNALQVVEAVPEDPVIGAENPPQLKLRIENKELRSDRLQCFVSGQRTCDMDRTSQNGVLEVKVQAEKSLTGRKTLYTITGPSQKGGDWFWYSYQWVKPEEESDDYE
ncbi:MAG: polysaccharide deacetylase family protein [Desulfovermiculus sp.]